ncbi:hypothetical protein NL463_29450, partial [Klebsiella pneumoniae]|nr:hypothetical protein [Klebsiella pneumoniae]
PVYTRCWKTPGESSKLPLIMILPMDASSTRHGRIKSKNVHKKMTTDIREKKKKYLLRTKPYE